VTKRSRIQKNTPETACARVLKDPHQVQNEQNARFFRAILQDQLPELARATLTSELYPNSDNTYAYASYNKYPKEPEGGLPRPVAVLRSLFATCADEWLLLPTDRSYLSSSKPDSIGNTTFLQPGEMDLELRKQRLVHFFKHALTDPTLVNSIEVGSAKAHMETHLSDLKAANDQSPVGLLSA